MAEKLSLTNGIHDTTFLIYHLNALLMQRSSVHFVFFIILNVIGITPCEVGTN